MIICFEKGIPSEMFEPISRQIKKEFTDAVVDIDKHFLLLDGTVKDFFIKDAFMQRLSQQLKQPISFAAIGPGDSLELHECKTYIVDDRGAWQLQAGH